MDDKAKWADIADHLCLRCGAFMYEIERWVCCSCDEQEEWDELPSCAKTWVLMYGNLFMCAKCGDLFNEEEGLEGTNKYCCSFCRS